MDTLVQTLLGPAGVTVLALFILWSGWKKWWVFGWVYRDKEAENKEWKDMAMRGTTIAEHAAKVAEKTTNAPS